MDELKSINKVDSAESVNIRRLAAGILEKRPWVWLRWSKVSGTWTLVPQISLDGAYELYRRYLKHARLNIYEVNSFTTAKGTPVISIIVALEVYKEPTSAEDQDGWRYSRWETLAYGGQDGFVVQSSETEERKMHGTAAALHKAMRNSIINAILLHYGEKVLYDFVDEAIKVGRAAILERDGTYRFISEKELVEQSQPVEMAKSRHEEQPQQQPPAVKPEILEELNSIPPDTLNQWILVYSEIVQKDPQTFGEKEWEDFLRWAKTPITQREIDELVNEATKLYRRLNDVPENEPVNRTEIFRYISRNFLERGKLITKLTQPEYHLLLQRIQGELWKTLKVVTPEEEEEIGPEIGEDEFPF